MSSLFMGTDRLVQNESESRATFCQASVALPRVHYARMSNRPERACVPGLIISTIEVRILNRILMRFKLILLCGVER
jgi:hypothetical protein